MAKDYTIDISYLEMLLDMFSSYDYDIQVNDDCSKLRDYLDRLKNNYKTNPPTTSLVERLEADYSSLEFYRPYYPYASSLAESKYRIRDFYPNKKFREIQISTEEVLELLKSFFKEQGDFYYTQFLEFLDEIHGHFEYVNPNDNMDGEMIYLSTVGEAFVSIANYPDIRKLAIASHEITHVTDAFNNPNFYQYYLIRETGAVFMEMIAADYLSKKLLLGNDNIKRKSYLHALIKERALDVRRKTTMLTLYGECKDQPLKQIFATLRSNGFNKNAIRMLEEFCLVEDYYYIVAQLTAIELYFIYLEDKAEALNILEDIVMNATDNNILDILKNHGVILGKSVERYEDSLIIGLKK